MQNAYTGSPKLEWTAEFLIPDFGEGGGFITAINGNMLYYLAEGKLCSHDLSDGENKVIFSPGSGSAISLCIAPDGRLNVLSMSINTEAKTAALTLRVLPNTPGDPESDTVTISDIPADKLYGGVQGSAVDAQGNIYFQGGDMLNVYDKNGAPVCSLERIVSQMPYLVQLSDGRIGAVKLAAKERAISYCIIPLNLQTMTWDEPIPIEPFKARPFCGRGRYLFFMIDRADRFIGYNTETHKNEVLFSCVELNINTNQVEAVSASEDGAILIASVRGAGGKIMTELALVSLKPAVEDKRITLEFAAIELNHMVREKITRFNRENPDYQIHITEYGRIGEGGPIDYKLGARKFREALLSGRIPDIADLANISFKQLAYMGIFEDLYPFINADPGLDRAGFMSSPLKAMETDGKLYYISPDYMLYALAGRPDVVGNDLKMTLEDLEALIKANPKAEAVFEWNRNTAFNTLLSNSIDDYIDWRTAQCRFDSEAFIKLLEISGGFPAPPDTVSYASQMVFYDGNALSGDSNKKESETGEEPGAKSLSQAISDGEVLMENLTVHNFIETQFYKKLMGGELAYKCYPSRSGGSALSLSRVFAMSASSAHKAVVWQFIRDMLTDGIFPLGFPILKNKFEEKAAAEMTEEYIPEYGEDGKPKLDSKGGQIYKLDENGNKIAKSKQGRTEPLPQKVLAGRRPDSLAIQKNVIWMYAASKEDYNKITALIDTSDRVQQYDFSIREIASGEAEAFFRGEKSAEEAAKAIQSKMNEYLRG